MEDGSLTSDDCCSIVILVAEPLDPAVVRISDIEGKISVNEDTMRIVQCNRVIFGRSVASHNLYHDILRVRDYLIAQ